MSSDAGVPLQLQSCGGFSLIELLLVLTIVAASLLCLLQYNTNQTQQQNIEKTILQIQQILNAGLAYYNANGSWPLTCSASLDSNGAITGTNNPTALSASALLVRSGYWPSIYNNPYGNPYSLACNSAAGLFYVITQAPNSQTAAFIAGATPLGYTSNQYGVLSATTSYVTAAVTIPGQNLNNARSINFASVYSHNACVPVPACPVAMMQPQIFVIPVAIAGVGALNTNFNNYNIYPLTAFSAYALNPGAVSSTLADCEGSSPPTACGSNVSTGAQVWRVCLTVATQQGAVASTNLAQQSVFALTRCTPTGEPG